MELALTSPQYSCLEEFGIGGRNCKRIPRALANTAASPPTIQSPPPPFSSESSTPLPIVPLHFAKKRPRAQGEPRKGDRGRPPPPPVVTLASADPVSAAGVLRPALLLVLLHLRQASALFPSHFYTISFPDRSGERATREASAAGRRRIPSLHLPVISTGTASPPPISASAAPDLPDWKPNPNLLLGFSRDLHTNKRTGLLLWPIEGM